ncbi:metal ABC transporter ATP-binding protein [Thermomicrobiaceae bacterium CFH 74404]|uniref:Metal ABC transporter ATP-binding protein n=1 Tax=Thermalbibacter longus TaxID=2951981 RepID=A0AA41WCT9_9BACT|nr:metal ABC transporter ATP-binding protein [Thermalbibacter longus]MCM8749617.1 metal ABC transporter ATP-binding protein [Thermalbibacter longus]
MQVQTELQPSAVTTSEPVIVVDRLTTGYHRQPVLEEISFAVPRGALVGVIGPNGGGKSTLFRAIIGLLKPWRGNVLIGGVPARPNPDMTYVPQTDMVDWVFPVTVWDVVMMGRYPRLGFLRRPGARDRELVEHALEQVRMQDYRHKPIGALSGGQRQRVFLARALAQEPSILLLDEPVSGVDAPTQHFIFELLEELCSEGRTALVASHDLSCVAQRFSQVLLLNRRMIGFGSPERIFTQELLNRTFDSHLLLLRYGDRVIVVETPENGSHAH